MGIFSKKKEREAFFNQIEEELIADELSKPDIKVSDSSVSPDVLTPDEVSLDFSERNNNEKIGDDLKNPLDTLKERMKASHNEKPVSDQDHNKPIRYIPKPKEPEDMQMQIDIDSAIEKSLLQKCKPYTLDEKGHDVAQDISPIYQLESVAEILRSENEKRIENLSKKYNIFFDTDSEDESEEENTEELPQVPNESQNVIPEAFEEPEPEQDFAKSHSNSSKTAAFVKMVSESLSRKSYRFEDNSDTLESKEENTADTDLKETNENLLFISDIDGGENSFHELENENIAVDNCPTETIKFTPVKDADSNTQTIQISSMTQPLDIKNELTHTKIDDNKFSRDVIDDKDFEEFYVKEEYVSSEQSKHFIKKTFFKKRTSFIQTVLSGLVLVIAMFFLIPSLNDSILEFPKTVSIVFTVLLTISFLSNFDAVFALKNILNHKINADIMTVLAYVSTMMFCINSIIKEKSAYESVFLCSFVIFARAFSLFLKNSYIYSNLRQITTKNPKKAITLLNDEATAFAMANHSIDGDILIAASKPADFVDDYFKYCEYGELLYGKVGIISLITAFLSVIIWFGAYKFFDSSYYAFFFSSSICCLAALPTVFLIDTLPLFTASKILNKKGAMISGLAAAEKLESANAAVITTNDLFPTGTITMKDLKVLANNHFDDTIMRATSLTAAVNSPLYPIFQKIAGTNSSYTMPGSDTVKYEEHLGLSGWVDNELLFIGNRTLMEAHGITVPSIDFDKRILKEGYFPVYLASGNEAYAVIIIEYNVDAYVAKQIQKLTNSGVTLLVSNNDPNVSEHMICDYFGLYEDSVKVMSNAGNRIYKTLTKPVSNVSAVGAFKGNPFSLVSMLNCAAKIKKSNLILKLCYIALAIIGLTIFVYSSFAGGSEPALELPLIYSVLATLVSIIAFIVKKP